MTHIEVQATRIPGQVTYRDVVILSVDGVRFYTECDNPEGARALAVRIAEALGIEVKPE